MPIAGQMVGGQLAVPSTLARLNYFYGQLLAQRDLREEQGYHVLLRRLMQRETFGTGTVAGLEVKGAGAGTERGVIVAPGLAIDPDGRELMLEDDVCITVADAARASATGTLAGTSASELATSLNERWGFPIDGADVEALRRDLIAAGLAEVTEDADYATLGLQLARISEPTPPTLPPATTLRDFLFAALVGRSFIGLRYLERGAEPAPAVLDSSCCGETQCQPSRLQQGSSIVAQPIPFAPLPDAYELARVFLSAAFLGEESAETTPPTPIDLPFSHDCRRGLTDYVLAAWRPVATPDACGSTSLPIVPLARVYWSRYPRELSGESRILSIDNASFRPLAPGTPAVRAFVEVATQCAPSVAIPPFFTSVSPANGAVLDASASEVLLEVTANAFLDGVAGPPGGVARWELDHYPPTGAGPSRYREDDSAGTPFSVAFEIVDDHARSTVRLKLGVTSGAVLAPGTYVCRINLVDSSAPPDAPTWTLHARGRPTVFVDGDPSPTTTVPSGDGRPGGVFEWRFAVTST